MPPVADVVEAQAEADEALTAPEIPAEDRSPAPAEAPPTPAEGRETTASETAPPSDVPRDAQGRFTKPDGTLSEPGEEPPAPAPEPEPDLSAYPAFTYRAEGQELAYPGAVRDVEGNVLFTPPAVQQLKHDLAYARAYQRRDAEAQRDLASAQAASQSADATLKAVLGKLEELFETSQGATTWEEFAQTPLGQWIVQRHTEWPKLRAEGLQRGFDQRTRALQEENQQYRARELDAQQLPLMLDRVEEAVTLWGTEAGLSQAEQRGLIQRLTGDRMLDLIFPRAYQDDPVTGVRAGQRQENLEVIRQELLFLQGLLKGRTPAQTAEAVRAENDRRTGKTGTKPPPTVAAGRGKTTVPERKKPYKTTREADEEIWG